MSNPENKLEGHARELMKRPTGSNADEWALFLEEYEGGRSFIAVQIAEAIEDAFHAIHLRNDGKYFYVEIEVGGQWVEIIKTYAPSETAIGHIVEPLGIRERLKAARAKRAEEISNV